MLKETARGFFKPSINHRRFPFARALFFFLFASPYAFDAS